VSTVRSVREHNSQGKSNQRPKKGCDDHHVERGRTLGANKKATYAMHRGHMIRRTFVKITRRFIAGLPPGGIVYAWTREWQGLLKEIANPPR
jgi:hypothetical protein